MITKLLQVRTNAVVVPSLLFFMLVFFVIASSCSNPRQPDMKAAAGKSATSGGENIRRGEYLVNAGLCNDCHSPKIFTNRGPVPDSQRLLSGSPANFKLPPIEQNVLKSGNWSLSSSDVTVHVGRFGISFASNLTPDSATGIGAWTKEIFIKTLRTGRHLGLPDGRRILPPMPWDNIGKMKDEDLGSIFTYLQSLPAVINKVPPPVTPDELQKLAIK